jgi:hypothetical protein
VRAQFSEKYYGLPALAVKAAKAKSEIRQILANAIGAVNMPDKTRT